VNLFDYFRSIFFGINPVVGSFPTLDTFVKDFSAVDFVIASLKSSVVRSDSVTYSDPVLFMIKLTIF